MRLFPSKIKDFFSAEEKQRIVSAIVASEKRTSGEVRVYIESHCRFVDPVDRAVELFYGLRMDKTEQRNGVIVYIALKDHQLAVYGDEGIHQKVGETFWKAEVRNMLSAFTTEHIVAGIVQVIESIGDALSKHFPYNETTDRNELPDEIVFGK